MNFVALFGNLAQPPEHGQTKTGTQYCNFSLGIREIYKTKKFNDKSTFIDCVVYGKSAEFMKTAGQGDELLVAQGQIQVQTWKDQTNKWQKKYRVLVDRFIIPKDKDASTALATNAGWEPQEVEGQPHEIRERGDFSVFDDLPSN
tara:strand:- start:387 stop:821 length:435 start_codon:yes stop_codon:yes gene_type:complete